MTSEAEYARLQALAMSGTLSTAGWARLFAEARSRGEYPPLVCKTEPEPEPEAGR